MLADPDALQAPVRIGVLVSGRGSNLGALLDAIAADPTFGAEIVVVACDRADAGALDLARAHGVPTVVEELASRPDRRTWERALTEAVAAHGVDVVVLAGFMRVLSDVFLERWPGRVLNTHPSLLPAFPGAHAVRDALEHGVKVTGATVHLVEREVDAGPIVGQRAVDVREDDDDVSLHARIRDAEHELLPACTRLLCRGRLTVHGRVVRIRDDREEHP